MSDTSNASESLIGKYFLSYSERGQLEWQGRVVSRPCPEAVYLVQIHSWGNGSASVLKLVSLEAMMKWSFYNSAQALAQAYDLVANTERDDYSLDEWKPL